VIRICFVRKGASQFKIAIGLRASHLLNPALTTTSRPLLFSGVVSLDVGHALATSRRREIAHHRVVERHHIRVIVVVVVFQVEPVEVLRLHRRRGGGMHLVLRRPMQFHANLPPGLAFGRRRRCLHVRPRQLVARRVGRTPVGRRRRTGSRRARRTVPALRGRRNPDSIPNRSPDCMSSLRVIMFPAFPGG